MARKAKKKVSKYVRNHKQPIPAMHENPRYTGPCKLKGGNCDYCRGIK